jgi:hypothetical protein
MKNGAGLLAPLAHEPVKLIDSGALFSSRFHGPATPGADATYTELPGSTPERERGAGDSTALEECSPPT